MKIFDFLQVIHHLQSLQRKSYPTAAVPEIKKTTNFIKLEYISYTMTPDCKRIKMQQNGGFLKKNSNFA